MNEAIKTILEIAVCAPSGENCQPWRFEVRDNQVDIFNLPERDNSLYSWGQRASYVAHGALIENIKIAASNFGCSSRVSLFPDPNNLLLVARISLEQISPRKDSLFDFIKERATNRKPYTNTALTADQRAELDNIPESIEKGRILFLEDEQKRKVVAQAAAGNERILFENLSMHNFFYDHITWTEKEDREKNIGFYIKTFELPLPAEKMFKLAKNWKLLQVLNRIGFSKLIVKQNAKVYASGSAFGIIAMPSNSAEDFVSAGMLFQRTWLTITKMGLSFQPLTGILFLMQRILGDEVKEFTPQQKIFVQDQYKQIQNSFGITNETIAMMFRIGDGGRPTARSLRLPPVVEYI